jgi:uncharacterized damage-inducible protein DinB
MPATAQQEGALTALLLPRWEEVSRKIEQLAVEIPGEKFEWRPTANVRTCGEILRHVAFWNQYVADSLRGKEANDTSNELPVSEYSTKASVLEALKRTSEDAAAALRERQTSMDPKTAELIAAFLEHTSEHYGQLVVYARLLDIVPPASR